MNDTPQRTPRLAAAIPAAARAALALACGAACGDGGGAGSAGVAPAPPAAVPPLFREVARERGIDFRHAVLADGRYRIAEVLGSGCAAFDADLDGRLDLYFATAGNGPGDGEPNRLFLQRAPGRFDDATVSSGLGDRGFGTGLAVADVDSDGDPDVFVGNWGPDALYLNDRGRFTRRTPDPGIAGPPEGLTTSAAFVDYDADGHPDLYVARYVVTMPLQSCDGRTPIHDYCQPKVYPPAQHSLYRNRGDGTFEEVTERAGMGGRPAPGLALTVEDFDDDGWPDIYVGNDEVGNFLWMNQRDGTFRDAGVEKGVAYDGLGSAEATMGIATGDVDGDGARDMIVTAFPGESSTYYRRTGSGAFMDATGRSGIGPASIPHTGWGLVLFDLELDGDLDLAVVNGSVLKRETNRSAQGPTPWEQYAEPGQLFTNDGAGKLSLVEPARAGFAADAMVGRSLLPADFDADGDVDLVASPVAGRALLWENVAPRAGRWLRVRCRERGREALWARVDVRAGGKVRSRTIVRESSYMASSDAAAHFGLGDAAAVEWAEVHWAGGAHERFAVEGTDREIVLERGRGEAR